MSPKYRALTLAVQPNSRGLGWVAFEGPFSPFDWGMVRAEGPERNATCLRRVERLIKRLTPETLVLEAPEVRRPRKGNRVTQLIRALAGLAQTHGIDVAIHTFEDIRACFQSLGAWTRHEIAEALARQFPQFAHRLPRKRRAWDGEHPKMALFNAASLALTHYQWDAGKLLESLAL